MLDADTKRRIDTCRDILVGKVPDPKSQVEQITIALIYKFMDDMDTQAETLGGKRSFFINGFAQYSWPKLLSPALEGHETLSLYSQAIGDMRKNTHLPALFRDIFKNAYLPYRDPETLRSFLREIDGFDYDHSERLGDAFEYLLSVLGSQGDAGQFRTPRHIIDFMVEVVDPQKHERILDPACGTSGFLISAWKHILANNTDVDRSPVLGNLLSTKERKQLAANIHGYDISPDMVRLSLVNMYLHGFTDPHIDEYDTLTSTERWGEHADVILANPPFMSPKGGIKPHQKFSIQATRSEVLFVDYMAEHLTPEGRVAIIVPEGIIFQSGTAYKKLREVLVKQSLVGVVSLPAGVFNPYSGVKTSILLLDKQRAKRQDKVLFVKIEHDGFNLGAQRRPVERNDLPEAKRLIQAFLQAPETFEGGPLAHAVARERIGESGDWNLSGERYKDNGAKVSSFPLMPFEEVCTLEYGASLPKSNRIDGTYPVIGSNGITGYHNTYLVEGPAIVIGRKGSAGEVTYVEENCFPIDTTYYIKLIDPARCDIRYLYRVLKTLDLPNLRGGAGIPGLNRNDVYSTRRIPLPPLDIQHEIVAEIEGYQKIIDGARQVVDSYRANVAVRANWKTQSIKDIAEINPRKSQLILADSDMQVSFVPMSDLSENEMFFEAKETRHIDEVIKQYTYFEDDDVLLAKVTPCFENGKAGVARDLVNKIGFGSSEYYVIRANQQKVLPEWIYLHVTTPAFRSAGESRMSGTGGLQRVPRDFLADWEIPVPADLEEQKAIVREIAEEQALINANKTLIERFEAKIQSVLDRIWTTA